MRTHLLVMTASLMALAAALAQNARPENARYRYDYFTANCATQVRDALDTAMGGALTALDPDVDRGVLNVPDPWYGTMADFADTLEVVERVSDELAARLD